ncbi:aminoacyl-tRNA deacylase [Actinomadura oligospora]|uniref:aminoacyl-tRNA deacylase n=1 Tax=Actinomadura oligospora TaxID=111804 RepID=UPI0004B56F4B|nr:YbaK/EbsC family protein [Actinomadura oligospora]
MKDALTIHRALLGGETRHEIVRLPFGIATADELPEALGLPAERCLVTRVYACEAVFRGDRFLAGAVVCAGRQPLQEAVRREVGARQVRPARADTVNAVTEYAAGLVSPLLLPDAMPLLIDRRIIESRSPDDVVYTATGEPSTALGIRVADLRLLTSAKPCRLFPPPQAPSLIIEPADPRELRTSGR